MTSDDREKDAPEVRGEASEEALTAGEDERRETGEDPGEDKAEAADLEDDEGPPSVPDISEPTDAKSSQAGASSADGSAEDDDSDSATASAVSRRLAPPPKPKGRPRKESAKDAEQSPPLSVVDKAPPKKPPPKPEPVAEAAAAEEAKEAEEVKPEEVEEAAAAEQAEEAEAEAAAEQAEEAEAEAATEQAEEAEAEEVEEAAAAEQAEEVPQEELVDAATAEAAEEVEAVQLDDGVAEKAEQIKPPLRSISIPDDEVPEKAAPESIKAVMAMRIISVGSTADEDEAPPEILDDLDVVSVHAGTPGGVDIDEAEELAEQDVAPDSSEQAAEEAEEPAAEEAEAAESEPEVAPAKPPPPPRRMTPPPPGAERAAKKKARAEKPARPQRRPWWEELFCEDFTRAHARPTQRQIVREVDFIEKSLGVAPGAVVLDLGCGEGHHAVELSSRGYGVVGYDLSLFQLALAADIAQERGQKINFLQGDMREIAFEEMFDAIYCWNTSFGYFEEEKNVAVAERMFRALRPGGSLLLDVANRDFIVVNQPSSVWYEGDSCVCMDEMSMDFITSRMKVKRSIILDDGRTCETYYSIRLYSLHELGKLLHDVGFRVIQASGDPVTPGKFFGERSPRIIVLAQRP